MSKVTPLMRIVYVDDTRQPQPTPLTISEIAVGTHKVRVEKDGFQVTTRDVTVEVSRTASIRLSLPPLTGTLTIRTKPSGAEAVLDGKSIGKTPLTKPIPIGQYRLQLSKDNFQPLEQDITIAEKRPTTVVEVLLESPPPPKTTTEPLPSETEAPHATPTPKLPEQGTLVVSSQPEGAMVYLDNTLMGPTPQEKRIVVGAHFIRVVHSGYKDYMETFSLSPGEKVVIQANLLKPDGGGMRQPNLIPFFVGALSVGILTLLAVMLVVLLRRRAGGQPRTAPTYKRNITPHHAADALFGKYQLLGEIGRGGMGVVYQAQYRTRPGVVALKIPFDNMLQDEELVQRFLRQAEIGAQLSHPHIVTILEAGEVDGTPYLAMEYIPGTDLRRQINQYGALPIAQAIKYVIQICEALDYVHLKQIYHRDIKPENVLLTEGDEVKVMDFGIALAKQMPKISVDGVRWLSGGYLCLDKEISPSSDLYSLGVVFYEMLTGRLPFESDDLVELIRLHERASPAPLHQWRADIPAGLESIVLRMLAKTPAERYPHAVEVIQTLRPYLMD